VNPNFKFVPAPLLSAKCLLKLFLQLQSKFSYNVIGVYIILVRVRPSCIYRCVSYLREKAVSANF